MTLTLNITDDLNGEEARELVEIAREQEKTIGSVLLESAREAIRRRREARNPANAAAQHAAEHAA